MSGSAAIRWVVGAVLGASLAAAPAARAQVAPWAAGSGYFQERYSFADPSMAGVSSISLTTIPFAARVELLRRASIEASGGIARAEVVDAAGVATRVEGPTDTDLRLVVPVGRDVMTLTAAAILPTGNQSLTLDEARVAGVIASDLLPMRVTNWGSGGGMAAAVALAQSFGAVGAGVSVGYRVAAEFEPLEAGAFAYRPGDELRVRLALDWSRGGAKSSLQATYFRYGDDRLDDRDFFRTGDRIQTLASRTFPLGRAGSGVTYAGMVHRFEGTGVAAPGDDSPVTLDATPQQTLVHTGAALRLPLLGGVLLPALDFRAFSRDDGIGQGYVGGVGSGLEVPMRGIGAALGLGSGTGMVLVPTARYRLGMLIGADDESSRLDGTEFGVTLRIGGVTP